MTYSYVKKITEATLPAGTYYIGDPCYSLPNHLWMTWLEAADYENEHDVLVANVDGFPVVGVGTEHGDGTYPDQRGNHYAVDAGLIGLVPVQLVDRETAAGNASLGVHKVKFEHPVKCYRDHAGVIHIGEYRIETG